MKIEYSSIYTEFPAELTDAEALLIYLREQAQYYAQANSVELAEGPPVLYDKPDYRFATQNLSILKWPAIRLFVSLEDLT